MSLLILGVCLYLFIYLCCLSRVLSSCPLFYCWSRVFSYFVARLLLVTILLMLAPCLIVASRFLLTIHVTSLSRVIRYFLQTQILCQTLDSHWFFVFPFFLWGWEGSVEVKLVMLLRYDYFIFVISPISLMDLLCEYYEVYICWPLGLQLIEQYKLEFPLILTSIIYSPNQSTS